MSEINSRNCSFRSREVGVGHYSHFSSIFSNGLSQKLGTLIAFRIGHELGYHLKKFHFDYLKIVVSISVCKKAVLNYIFFKKS